MAKTTAPKETPLMAQYNSFKAKYPEAILLFRVGDFYETFGQDAVQAAQVLDIVLTKRSNGAASHVELAGFPHHALDSYLPKLVRAGHRVAICDQVEDPKQAKGLVKRGVTELVTPGLTLNDKVLDHRSNNYLAALHVTEGLWGIAFLDLSTGEFLCTRGNRQLVDRLLQRYRPAELVFNKGYRNSMESWLRQDFKTFTLEPWIFGYEFAQEKLQQHFGTPNLKGFGVADQPEAVVAAGVVLHYLQETEHTQLGHIRSLQRIEEQDYVWLDKFTIRNLELLQPQQEGGVPLLSVLDRCAGPMGARLMKKWVVMPLKHRQAVEARQAVVAELVDHAALLGGLREHIQSVGDMERLVGKVATLRINPRELLQLRRSLGQLQPLQELIAQEGIATAAVTKQLQACEDLLDRLTTHLADDAPLQVNQGGVMKQGVNADLDELRRMSGSGKDFLQELQHRESAKTGISSLKVGYNKVFGYYLEVTHAHKDKVPPEWIRKQTLTNAERYITEELKTYEERILSAEDKILALEAQMYADLVDYTATFVGPLQDNAVVLARLDCLCSLATVAVENDYCRPTLSEATALHIAAGRHPVIEQQLPPDQPYVPNDLTLDPDSQQIIIITGPNMSGKSALLRQVALIVLMAQMGGFVPAAKAEIGLVDKVFTRVGASDNLARGESTFMVEMTETAAIMNNLSARSLVLMDEIGRGTSTYDGISIAWSIVEYLHNHPKSKAKTLFATHYHELNQLEDKLERVRNYNLAVKEVGSKVVFLRQLQEGGSEHSFGIHVAQMAGMPKGIVQRAAQLMAQLEQDKQLEGAAERLEQAPAAPQMGLFEAPDPRLQQLQAKLQDLDINTLTPLEAMLKLHELLAMVKK